MAASEPEFLTNPYMFTGRRFDIETGLYYYRARYYNPHIGRFLQTDPIGYVDGMNWYSYCGNNPLVRLDPSGLGWNASGDHWHQDYAMSCVPASLVNIVWKLQDIYEEKYEDNWTPWEESDFRAAFQDKLKKSHEDLWSSGGRGVSFKDSNDVLNAYLQEVDPCGILPRYKIDDKWEEHPEDIFDLVKDKGPVMFAVDISEAFYNQVLSPTDNIWHAVVLLGPTEYEDEEYFLYSDPMWTSHGIASEGVVREIWANIETYKQAMLVPY